MSLKLIGAGLGRTGTSSLKLALEQIGFGPCYHMKEVIENPMRGAAWVRAAHGQPDWNAIFDGYAATVDYPGCAFWRQLIQVYPHAKVLLSVRGAQDWFDSTQLTIFADAHAKRVSELPLAEFFRKTVFEPFGERLHDRDFMVAAFERHNAEVEHSVPAERLLIYDVAQGWAPLCEFLQVPLPDSPFPHKNTRGEFGRPPAS